MKFLCRSCQIEVTKELVELTDLTLLNTTDGQPYIPEGYYLVSDGKYFYQTEGHIFINKNDLIHSDYHSDQSRLNGCCGYDGCDGMNRVCSKNHEIATERSDCWMPHSVAFEPERVMSR